MIECCKQIIESGVWWHLAGLLTSDAWCRPVCGTGQGETACGCAAAVLRAERRDVDDGRSASSSGMRLVQDVKGKTGPLHSAGFLTVGWSMLLGSSAVVFRICTGADWQEGSGNLWHTVGQPHCAVSRHTCQLCMHDTNCAFLGVTYTIFNPLAPDFFFKF